MDKQIKHCKIDKDHLQNKFIDSILKLNGEKIIEAVANGAKINKKSIQNTINFAIKVLLDQHVDKFNLEIITILLNLGAEICNIGVNNTLTLIIRKKDRYINNAKFYNNEILAEKNVWDLLKYVLSKGARADNFDIVSVIADQKNMDGLGLVRMLCEQKILPDIQQTEHNTLSCAVKTNNLDILKIICDEYKALPNVSMFKNTLYYAVGTNNPEIIHKIILRGGKPNNIYSKNDNHYSGIKTTFAEFVDTLYRYNDDKMFDRALKLLMCSGIKIYDYVFNDYVFNNVEKQPNSYYKEKITRCYHLLSRKDMQCNEEQQDIIEIQKFEELRSELIKTMNELMEENPVQKRNIVENIDIGMQYCVPIPCVHIIYEYQRDEQLVQYIDWSEN